MLRICYPNAPHRYVTLTFSLPKYTNDRRGLQRPRQSLYILNTDQFAGNYCNTLQHSYRYRSLLTALQSVERKFIILNWKEDGNLNLLLIVCLFVCLLTSVLHSSQLMCYTTQLAVSLQARFALSLSLLSHPRPHIAMSSLQCSSIVQMFTTPVYNGRSGGLILNCLQNKITKL